MASRTRLRHRLREFAICFAFGAITTVLVAWGCALTLDPDRIIGRPTGDVGGDAAFSTAALEPLRTKRDQHASDDEIIVCDQAVFGAIRRMAFVDPYWHAAIDSVYEVEFDATIVPFLLVRTSAGWPLPALVGERRITGANPTSGESVFDRDWTFGMRFAGDAQPRDAPFRPRLIGFTANTIVGAATCWLLLFAPFAARRALRRRRGLCERCAYPRGSSEVCSECGATRVRASSPSTAW